MGVIRHFLHPKNQHRRSTPTTAIALLFIFFFFFTEASSTIPLSAHLPYGRGFVGAGEKRQGVMKKATVSESLQKQQMMRPLSRRRLGGLGSSPPTCRSKCGRCWPCKPVHVPIQPGQKMPLEYYPEAWRCKCGNKLFMP
ncbi:EPIDERMAL PATTERNING FACTOR-like protein 5 [Cinnamomum micranthum f. kanehirae]|uniref:Epidermal patterning factor-like protein n=1 Tax=Cinnamomum micranthum f. kanehirae TaxID=337451 RepID=A0A3S3P4G4_9MAGN|nr:EPIDERMAL PATTERNING FACTOR-like protein 5 [Cinnamomum micranthum f. kanehirae]